MNHIFDMSNFILKILYLFSCKSERNKTKVKKLKKKFFL